MHVAVMAYNLKKPLKFIDKSAQTKKKNLVAFLIRISDVILAKTSLFKPLSFLQIFILRTGTPQK